MKLDCTLLMITSDLCAPNNSGLYSFNEYFRFMCPK